MSEFNKLLSEAFAGLAPYDHSPSRAELKASLEAFRSRDRTLRRMLWFAVAFMTGVSGVGGALFFSAEGGEVRPLVLGATLFLFAMFAISWAKLFLFLSQQHLTVMRELKFIQLHLVPSEDAE